MIQVEKSSLTVTSSWMIVRLAPLTTISSRIPFRRSAPCWSVLSQTILPTPSMIDATAAAPTYQ